MVTGPKKESATPWEITIDQRRIQAGGGENMAGKGDKDQDRAEEAPPKKNRKATWKAETAAKRGVQCNGEDGRFHFKNAWARNKRLASGAGPPRAARCPLASGTCQQEKPQGHNVRTPLLGHFAREIAPRVAGCDKKRVVPTSGFRAAGRFAGPPINLVERTMGASREARRREKP